MKAKTEQYINQLSDNSVILATQPTRLQDESIQVEEFQKHKAAGIFIYFKPETRKQIQDLEIQVRMTKQLKKAKLS